MAESAQYLRFVLDGLEYLLPSEASRSIEQRDNLTTTVKDAAPGQGNVTAWYVVQNQRWPAFYLGRDFRPSSRTGWQRAIFLEGEGHPIGLIADEVQLLPRSEMRIEAFCPLGAPPTKAGSLFNAAWMREEDIVLVVEPNALVAYLTHIWRNR